MWSQYHVSNECEHHTDPPCLLAWFHSLIYLLTLSGAITFYHNFTYWWTFLEQKVPFGRLIPSVTTTALLSQGTCICTPLHLHIHIQMYVYFCNACTYAWFYFVMYFFLMVLGLFYHLRMTWQSELKRLKWQFKISVLVHMQQFLGMR